MPQHLVANSYSDRAVPPMPRWSVRALLVWLVLACLMPGIIGAAIFFVHEYETGRNRLERSTLLTTRALVQAVDHYLSRVQAIAQTLAASESLSRNDLAAFHQEAREVVAATGLGTNVVLRDESGRQILNTVVDFGRALPSQLAPGQVRGVFAAGKPTISDIFIGPVLKRPIMSVDVPVRISGRIVYALAIGILPEHFNAILDAQDLPSDWVTAVFDASGTVVARTHAPEQFVGQKAAPKLFAAMMASPEGSIGTTTLDGIPVLSFYSRSPVTHWKVAIGIPRKALEQEFMQPLSMLAAGVVALFGIGLMLARFVGARIARSVGALTAPAAALGNGGTVAPPEVHIKEAAEVAAAIERAGKLLEARAATIRASETRFRASFEQAAVGMAHVALGGHWLKVNRRLCDIVGYEREELLGLTFQDITFPDDLAADLAQVEQLLAGTIQHYSMEKRYVRKDGSLVWINLTGSLVRTPTGEPDYFISVVEDIQRRKEAEAALEAEREAHRRHLEQQVLERTDELMAANRELEVFTLAASHDFRGPLRRIKSISSLLAVNYRDRLEEEGLRFIDVIRQNAGRLAELVDDLLQHARTTQRSLDLQAVDVAGLTRAVLQDKAEDIRTMGADVQVTLPSARVLADPQALAQVVGNLVENALKYSGRTARPTVEIGGEPADGRFRLWVRDNGIGFDMAYHDRIFEMFQRLHSYDDYTGSGVGLALVKRAVERMGGRIWAESEPGKGATFFLEMQAAA